MSSCFGKDEFDFFKIFPRAQSLSGMTGKEAAEALLHREGIYDVRVEYVR